MEKKNCTVIKEREFYIFVCPAQTVGADDFFIAPLGRKNE